MDLFAEDLHPRLREVFHDFDNYCKEHGIFYSIVSDEADEQGYLIKKDNLDDVDNLVDWLQGVLERTQVHLDVDKDRKDGVLLSFTLESIQDDHWDPMTGHPGALKGVSKKEDPGQFTIFAKPGDARRVRAGKTTIQKKGNIRARDASFEAKLIKALLEDPIEEESIEEDQYKSPTGKHRRDQSAFPSSFGPSRTFGGRTTRNNNKPKKEDFNRKLEWLLNEELDEAEAEALKELFNLIVQYQDVTSGDVEGDPDAVWEGLLTTFDEFKNSAMSDEARDISKRFFDAVGSWNPEEKFRSEEGQNLHICPEALDEIFNDIVALRNVRLYGREEGPTVDQEVEMEQGFKPTKPNMRPLGLFGPGDKRQPEGTPPSPGANVAKSIGERVPRNR